MRVDIETEWNLKPGTLRGRRRVRRVDIETEWNLKRLAPPLQRQRIRVDIETEWNLKSGSLILYVTYTV